MQPPINLMIVGASARAAAFSALRAGFQPWCADLFADADLQARCPVIRLAPRTYPDRLLWVVGQEVLGPWMYTGALENRPGLVKQMAQLRRLWGIPSKELAWLRSPFQLAGVFEAARVRFPAVRRPGSAKVPPGKWLVKPLASAGGAGIHFWDDSRRTRGSRRKYLQEFIEGESQAAVYVSDGRNARLLGVTRQLVGEHWLHAAPFRYCGSIGPLAPEPALLTVLERLGNSLVIDVLVKGLFGVDYVLRDGVPWPVEVNPRYTASVEVLEYATGLHILALHGHAFCPAVPVPPASQPAAMPVVGKAILFAREAVTFPSDGPWLSVLRTPGPIEELPAFADIPHAGEQIDAGRPILTFFARGDSLAACEETLRRTALDLDRWLFGRYNEP
jgi:predicted ATP-grasp superfamily ATP-dependent carboligase